MNSLDPRVKRLPVIGEVGNIKPKAPLDQFGTFEVFVEAKEGKPFQHEGAIHAPNLEMAYVLAKETFTRRFTCSSLFVVETRDVLVSPMTEGTVNVYDQLATVTSSGAQQQYEIFQLAKRGKQHVHAGSVMAGSPEESMSQAKEKFNSVKTVYNVWAIPTSSIRYTTPEEKDFWITLPEKRFRDAADYKGGDKLKVFLENRNKS